MLNSICFGFNTMDNQKLDFLLDLFAANYTHAYLSVMEFKSVKNNDYNRIELIVANVGRLCMYQKFEETEFDDQRPVFKVFYSSAIDNNQRTLIQSPKLLSKAINIIYKCKKYYEQNPQIKMLNNDSVLRAINNNEKLLIKSYELNKKQHLQRWFDDENHK